MKQLINTANWREVPLGSDPFAGFHTSESFCDDTNGINLEIYHFDRLRIDSFECNYATVSQPSLHKIQAGNKLKFNFSLNTIKPEPNRDFYAQLALQIGDELIWEHGWQLPIFAEFTEEVVAPKDFSVGDDIYFHVRNHGNNHYLFYDLVKYPQP